MQPLSLSLRTGGCSPCTRTHVKLLGPCFKTGKREPFCQNLVRPATLPEAASNWSNKVWQTLATAPHSAGRGGSMTSLNTGCLCFHFTNFRYSLTLFSKSFASFPHGTCALSVSHQYLALDGIYHPIRAAIPNNSTLWHRLVWTDKQECHPLSCPFPRNFVHHNERLCPQITI